MKESPFMMKLIARIYRFVHYNNAWKYRIWGRPSENLIREANN